jgi:hypothetical protein
MWLWFLTKVVLFIALVPGVLLRLPKDATLRTQALVHGFVYALLLSVIYRVVFQVESMTNPSTKSDTECPAGSHKCPSGDCVLDGDKHSPCH